MKLRYIDKIRIGATDFKIKYCKSTYGGGSFDYNKHLLTIGTKSQTEVQILATFIHEVKEAINVEQGCRYQGTSVLGNYVFTYNHDQHADFCERLASAIEQFVV